MPSTLTGVAVSAAGGGAMGGVLLGADYGVILGAIIGASASVIASKDNNLQKVINFFLALGSGSLLAHPFSEMVQEFWQKDISPKITAIIVSALLIPILVLGANKDNLKKLFGRVGASIDKNFSSITQAIKDWRNKGGN